MQVDLVSPEGQRAPTVAEGDRLHAEYVFVESHGGFQVTHRQYQMVEPLNPHALFS
jgi:hypothetical protein